MNDYPEIGFSEAFGIINRFSVESGRRLRWSLSPRRETDVYFFYSRELGAVKIGMSTSTVARAVEIARRHKIDVVLVVISGAPIGAESSIQRMMKYDSIEVLREREWFSVSLEMAELLVRLGADLSLMRINRPIGRWPEFRYSWISDAVRKHNAA